MKINFKKIILGLVLIYAFIKAILVFLYLMAFFLYNFTDCLSNKVTFVNPSYNINLFGYTLISPIGLTYTDMFLGGTMIPSLLIIISSVLYIKLKVKDIQNIKILKMLRIILIIAYLTSNIIIRKSLDYQETSLYINKDIWLIFAAIVVHKEIEIYKLKDV